MSVGVNSAPCSVTRTARGPRSSCPLTERVAERVPPPRAVCYFPGVRFPRFPYADFKLGVPSPLAKGEGTGRPPRTLPQPCSARRGQAPSVQLRPAARPCGAACGRGWRSVLELCRPSRGSRRGRSRRPLFRSDGGGGSCPGCSPVSSQRAACAWVLRRGPRHLPRTAGASARVCHPEGDSGLSEQRKPWVIDVTSDMASLRLSVTLAGEAT